MWTIKTPKGELLVETISDTKEDAYWSLFDQMPEEFRAKHWKNPKNSRKAYPDLGFKAVKVKLVEVKR